MFDFPLFSRIKLTIQKLIGLLLRWEVGGRGTCTVNFESIMWIMERK